MNQKNKSAPVEVFEQALKNFEQALKNGLKLQEESAQWWSNTLQQAATVDELQKQIQAMTKDVLPHAQKRVKEYAKLVDENGQNSLELFQKAIDTALTPPSPENGRKWVEFWQSSVEAVRRNAQAVTEINDQLVDSWLSFARKTGGTTVPKAKA